MPQFLIMVFVLSPAVDCSPNARTNHHAAVCVQIAPQATAFLVLQPKAKADTCRYALKLKAPGATENASVVSMLLVIQDACVKMCDFPSQFDGGNLLQHG